MIEFTEVRKTFGLRSGQRVEALNGVTLRVETGEAVAVVGPNGAGKSTLLALVLGFLRPTAGELAVGGRIPREWVNDNGAGWLPERFDPPREWTVRGAMRALAALEGRRSGARSRVDQVLERFGLAAHAKRPVGSLSRGLLQRLGIAQAAIARRSLVILDEPTNALDPDGRRLFRETARELRDAGATLVIASHDLAELERTTDRAFVLEAGRVREVIDVVSPAAAGVYAIRVTAAEPVVRDAFPDATLLESDATAAPGTMRWEVRVDSVERLNARLSRLLATGALVHEIVQAAPSLEDRIRQTGTPAQGDT